MVWWPPKESTPPGVYAIVFPVWPRGLDEIQQTPTRGVVDLLEVGQP
jgi:hypothetical protein